MSEQIRKACKKFNLKVVFKSGLTLHSQLTKVKDPLPKEELAGVVYQIPASVVRCVLGNTEARRNEHKDAYKGQSAIAEHQWDQQHQVKWEDTRVLDRATRPVQLMVKEALHIHKTPANNRLNTEEGYELSSGWIATIKKLGGRFSSSHANVNCISALTSAPHPDCICTQAQEPCLYM